MVIIIIKINTTAASPYTCACACVRYIIYAHKSNLYGCSGCSVCVSKLVYIYIYICDRMIYLYIYNIYTLYLCISKYWGESNLSSFIFFFKRIGHMPFIEQSERRVRRDSTHIYIYPHRAYCIHYIIIYT